MNEERLARSIHLHLISGRNWLSPSGEPLHSVILRCESTDQTAASDTAVYNADARGEVELSFVQHFAIDSDLDAWNAAINRPIVISLIELNRRKKAPTQVRIGAIVLDLLAELKSEFKTGRRWVQFAPVENQQVDWDYSLQVLPQALLEFTSDIHQLPRDLNFITLSLDAFYASPDTLNHDWGTHQFACGLYLPLGLTSADSIIVDHGQYAPGQNPLRRRCWWQNSGANTEEDFIPLSSVVDSDIFRRPPTAGDVEEFNLFNKECVRININTEHRFFINQDNVDKLEQYILLRKSIILEIFSQKYKQSVSTTRKKKKNAEEKSDIIHGICLIPLEDLLLPGNKEINGVYKFSEMNSDLYQSLTGRSSVILSRKISPAEDFRSSKRFTPQAYLPKSATTANEGLAPASGNIRHTNTPQTPTVTSEQCTTEQDSPDFLANTYVRLCVKLDRPIVEKCEGEEIPRSVQSLVAQCSKNLKWDKFQHRTDPLKIFNQAVRQIGSTMLSEIRSRKETPEVFIRNFILQFNACEKYVAMKENLKLAILDIIRQKSLSIADKDNSDEWRAYIINVFIFLVKQCSGILQAPLVQKTAHIGDNPIRNYGGLAHAEEAYALGMREKARQFCLEQIANDQLDWKLWLYYGQYLLSTRELELADQCFRRALSLETAAAEHSALILLMLSISASLQGFASHAHTTLVHITNRRPTCFVSAIALAVQLLRQDESLAASALFQSAEKMWTTALRNGTARQLANFHSETFSRSDINECPVPRVDAGERSVKDGQVLQPCADLFHQVNAFDMILGDDRLEVNQKSSSSDDCPSTLLIVVAKFLTRCKAYQFAGCLMSKLSLSCGDNLPLDYFRISSYINYQMDKSNTLELIEEGLRRFSIDKPLILLRSLALFRRGDHRLAMHSISKMLVDPQSQSVVKSGDATGRLANILSAILLYTQAQYKQAHTHLTKAIQVYPSPIAWLWQGKTLFRLGDFTSAERAFGQLNSLDDQCAESWVMISMINTIREHELIAEQAYRCAERCEDFVTSELGTLLTELEGHRKKAGFNSRRTDRPEVCESGV